MTAMFHDVHKEDRPKTQKQRMVGLSSDEILYADDTTCVTKSVAAMNRLVREIEVEGATYGLKLNHNKCEYLAFGKPAIIRYSDGANTSQKARS